MKVATTILPSVPFAIGGLRGPDDTYHFISVCKSGDKVLVRVYTGTLEEHMKRAREGDSEQTSTLRPG